MRTSLSRQSIALVLTTKNKHLKHIELGTAKRNIKLENCGFVAFPMTSQ